MMRIWMMSAALVALCLSGCDDDKEANSPTDGAVSVDGAGGMGGGGGEGGMGGAVCADFPDEHTALLNAPTNATVIQKTPTHPSVGPEGLP